MKEKNIKRDKNFIFVPELTSKSIEIKSKNEIHGVNLIPYLTGDNKNDPHEFLFWRNNFMQNDPKLRIEGSAIRNGDFKFIKNIRIRGCF